MTHAKTEKVTHAETEQVTMTPQETPINSDAATPADEVTAPSLYWLVLAFSALVVLPHAAQSEPVTTLPYAADDASA